VESISHSPAETETLGESWGRVAKRGLVIALNGDLGAGKTRLVKGIARGLGVSSRVHSPTFTLVNVYSGGRLTLFHLDLYRLETCAQLLSAGIEDYWQPDGVTVVEWAERWFGNEHSTLNTQHSTAKSPSLVRRVHIEVLNETERRIVHEDFGA
jgi:tRNA threonylcarbamoyladenosine biosynthesis protein TsaE